jgi:hypothetical protein
MSSVIQNLLDTTIGDGARSTKFECSINFANRHIFGKTRDVTTLVKTSQFPGKTHEPIDIKFKGRNIPVKGQTKYDNTWTCTFYLTEDHMLKVGFENWIEAIDQVHNVKDMDAFDNYYVSMIQSGLSQDGYTSNMLITQNDFSGDKTIVTYELFNVYPKSVSAVDVDYSDVGNILEFTVEFSYSYYNSKITPSFDLDVTGALKDMAKNVADDLKAEVLLAAGSIKDYFGDTDANALAAADSVSEGGPDQMDQTFE